MSIPSLAALTATRVVVIVGKGGVGKTTVTALIAHGAADSGRRVLVVEFDGKPTLARRLDGVDGVDVRTISAPAMLEEYLRDHGFGRIAKRLVKTGVIEVVGTAAPGIDDVVVLGKIKQLEQRDDYDLIVVDGPAAGHAVTFLTSATGLLDAVKSGPVHKQSTDVRELLADAERCQVVLVTMPETTPVNEVIETAFALEDRVGVRLGPVVVNAVDEPDVALAGALAELESLDAADDSDERDGALAAAEFRLARHAMQQVEIARLGDELALEQVTIPLDPTLTGASGRGTGPTSSAARGVGDDTDRALASLVGSAGVIVCCGAGGVGKTTSAAVVGLEAARQGRRVVVVTIDPARRLADALGLAGGLGSEPTRIELGEPGELWAMMLDTAATFDRIVTEYAADTEQAERIVSNAFYRNMASALSGTQEYMAAETLHVLHRDERFDLVVVDTPPSRQALDFLDAPGVLNRFLGHPVFRLMMLPAKRGMKVFNLATQPMLRAIGKVVGSDVLADAVAFFQAFAGMEGGFRDRAQSVDRLLRSDDTKYLLVASPHDDAVAEASWFADRLADHAIGVGGAIVNRMHPAFGDGTAADAAAFADGASGRETVLWDNLAHLRRLRETEAGTLAPLLDRIGAAPVGTVALLAGDVHDLEGLLTLRGHLFG